MSTEKEIPQMTGVPTILRNKDGFISLLNFVKDNNPSKEQCGDFITNHPAYNLNKYTAKNSVLRLKGYYFFAIDENKTYILTRLSKKFLNGNIDYEDYILSCLSNNLEWSYFLEDIYDVVKENGPLGISDILSRLRSEQFGYIEKKWDRAYLGKILPLLDLLKIIRYDESKASIGQRKRKDVLRHSRFLQRELLKYVQMVNRRPFSKATLAKYYRHAVETYIPRGNWSKKKLVRTQQQIDKILSKKPKPSKTKKKKFKESKWQLTDTLWDWQKIFLKKWMQKKKGIVKVVTGAGKTHLAMGVIEQLYKENHHLHVTIIVPTIVLLEQWYDNLTTKLQLSPEDIGLRGGGYTDTFNKKKILITVINSAIKNNFIELQTRDIENNLLIVDECHRSGSPEFKNIFKVNRSWELGLSATPEREMDNAFEEVLVKNLGPIIGNYTYNDALRDKIIPYFNIYNYAVNLTNQERAKYERISQEIQNIIERLKYKYPQLNDSKTKLEVALKNLQKRFPKDKDLFLYFQKTKERKDDIIYPALNRKKFVSCIFKKINESDGKKNNSSKYSPLSTISDKDKVIVFHEKIDEINSLFIELEGKNVSIYHSGLPNTLNRIGLDLYQSGKTKILLSVKALVEGVDVPRTNIGIIMASSSSQTQRIQSLGRVLRKAEAKNETKLFIAYVKNSTDERIYKKKIDWDKIIGKGNIEFRMWTEFGDVPIEPPKPKKQPDYVDIELIDENMLEEGSVYPGKYEGESLSFDSKGGLFKKTIEGRKYITNNGELWKVYKKYKPGGGRLIINSLGHVLIKYKKKENLVTIYLGSFKSIVNQINNI